jgi:hypothetical protein
MTTAFGFDNTRDMSRFLAIFIFIFSAVMFTAAFAAAPSAEKPENIFSCHDKALAQKDCLLRLGHTKIQVWHDKILYGDGVNLVTENVPDQNADVVWKSLSTLHLSNRWFIELAFWSAPDAKTGIETLNWAVFEITGGRVPFKFKKPIQKRVKNSKGQWHSDKVISHQLLLKNGKVFAEFGLEKNAL